MRFSNKVMMLAVSATTAVLAVAPSAAMAQGLPNGRHTLELELNGDGPVPLKLIRSYSPPLK